jgi:hypothetical protein
MKNIFSKKVFLKRCLNNFVLLLFVSRIDSPMTKLKVVLFTKNNILTNMKATEDTRQTGHCT